VSAVAKGQVPLEAEGAPLPGAAARIPWALVVPLGVVVLELLLAVLAPELSPHNPLAIQPSLARVPPRPGYWLGTDDLGRDILSRLLYGARDSLLIALGSVTVGALVGTAMGLVAGYAGGTLDWVGMRVVDVLLSIPAIVVALVVIAILGQGLADLILAIGVGEVPVFARTVRGTVLGLRSREYVEAAQAAGASHLRIVLRHILPNAIGPILVLATLDMGVAILSAAGLTYLGLGPPPPAAEWGSMLNEAQNFIPGAWWMAVFPGLAIMVTVLAFNLLGDALRDALDPRRRLGVGG
jgi:peptide/nickel transport system permease protein